MARVCSLKPIKNKMTTIELETWKAYDEYKSSQKKIDAMRNLKFCGQLDSLDKLSKEFLQNKSSTIRQEAIGVIEYLELKLSPDRNELEFYNELLTRYKLKSVKNFWYKDFKEISLNELDDEAIKFSSRKVSKAKSDKKHLRFKITDRIEGILTFSLQPRGNSPLLQNLSYGFISGYRDFAAGYINNYPFDQNHSQENLSDGYSLFERERKNILADYDFVKELEAELLTIDDDHSINSKIFGEFHQVLGFNKELWFLLSLINVLKANGELDQMRKTIEEGLRRQDPKKAGSGWIKYYEEKLNTGFNNL